MAENTSWKQIGERVGRLILSKGYRSVELFAHEHAIHKSVLSRLINGKREIRISTFLKIAEALEIGLDDLAMPTRPNPSPSLPRVKSESLRPSALKAEKSFKTRGERSSIHNGVAKLDLSELRSIELHRSQKDKNPIILGVLKKGGGRKKSNSVTVLY